MERLGVCSAASGWEPSGTGPNCTFVGSDSWSGQQLMIGSCARNVRAALEGHSQAWITLLLDAGSGGALIFEDQQRSGDPDGTRAALRAWAASDSRVRLLLAQPLLYPRWSRTQRLALCRNMLAQEAVRRLPERGAFIALDLDCHGPVVASVTAALASMAARTLAWDVLTANTRKPKLYYDRWALRSSTLGLDYDCWFNASQKKLHGSCPEVAISVDAAAAPFAVDSAFNGLGLYRVSALRTASDCRYRGTKNSYLCEHVPFHQCMRTRELSIGVLPSLATDCGAPTLSRSYKLVTYRADGSVAVEPPQMPAAKAAAKGKAAAKAAGTPSLEGGSAAGHRARHRGGGGGASAKAARVGTRTASVLLAAFITVIHSFRLDARLVVPRQRLPLACDVRASADDDSSAIGNDGSGGMLPPSEMERLQARIAKIQESGMASPSEKLFELATRETPSSLMRSFFATTSPEISQAMQDAITSLLGTLPPLEFDARLTTSGDKLAALMLQLQMTGYMLRNAEYVMTLRRLLQLKTRSMAEYRAAFDKLDLDSSGFIEVAEVEELLQSVYAGDEVPSYEVSSLITLFDVDGDGRISWEEFASALGADEAAEPPSTLLSLPEAEAAASSMAQPKLTGTIKVILDDNSEVEMDANEYMEQLKAEAQLLRQEIQGVIDGKDASPLSTSISAYVSSLPEPQLKLLTSGISEDVVGAMRLLVQYILREPGGSDAELAKDQEVTMEQAKLQTLCLYQLVLGYKLREAEATGEANDAIGA